MQTGKQTHRHKQRGASADTHADTGEVPTEITECNSKALSTRKKKKKQDNVIKKFKKFHDEMILE